MKKVLTLFTVAAMALLVFSCQKADLSLDPSARVPQAVIDQLSQLGFNPDGIEIVDAGYRIERDIVITDEFLRSNPSFHRVPNTEQFHTNNLVSVSGASRTITMYIDAPPASGGASVVSGKNPGAAKGGGKPGGGGGTQFSQAYADALADAMGRYNAQNLSISFARVDNANNADIVFSRLSKGEERQGYLGSAGFPSASGDPYGQILMSGIIMSTYGWSQEAVATVMAHEMGHCIGFRHTDYYDRSISCGGGPYNEGDAGIGAVHIPETPNETEAVDEQSWMLSCYDGQGRYSFSTFDVTALQTLFPNPK